MGIKENIDQIQAEAAAKAAEDFQEKQRLIEEERIADALVMKQAIEIDIERGKAVIAELSPVLEAVKARELLEEVRDTVWHIGEVDPEPIPTLFVSAVDELSKARTRRDSPFKEEPIHVGEETVYGGKLALRLRATYHTLNFYGEDVPAAVVHGSDSVSISIAAARHPEDGFGVWVKSGLSHQDRENPFSNSYYLVFIPTSLEEPQVTYSTLQSKLAEACIKLGSRRGDRFSVSEFVEQENKFAGQGSPSFEKPSVKPTSPSRFNTPLEEYMHKREMEREIRPWYRRLFG